MELESKVHDRYLRHGKFRGAFAGGCSSCNRRQSSARRPLDTPTSHLGGPNRPDTAHTGGTAPPDMLGGFRPPLSPTWRLAPGAMSSLVSISIYR